MYRENKDKTQNDDTGENKFQTEVLRRIMRRIQRKIKKVVMMKLIS